MTQILPLNLLPNDKNCKGSFSDEEKQLSTAFKAIELLYYEIFEGNQSLMNIYHFFWIKDILYSGMVNVGQFHQRWRFKQSLVENVHSFFFQRKRKQTKTSLIKSHMRTF